MDRARAVAGNGHVPSKTALRRALGVRWDTASEVHQRLSAEAGQAVAERRAQRRATLARLRPGRGVVRRPPVVRVPLPAVAAPAPVASVQPPSRARSRKVRAWPLLLLAAPAFVSIWSGWVALGGMTGFGVVHPLPGIADGVSINTAITLPIGLETYAAYALAVWLTGAVPARARKFAKWSAIGSLILGAGGQVTYHLLVSDGPWVITTAVACLPVAVLGMGAALYHLVHEPVDTNGG
jgi:hypothetical protein